MTKMPPQVPIEGQVREVDTNPDRKEAESYVEALQAEIEEKLGEVNRTILDLSRIQDKLKEEVNHLKSDNHTFEGDRESKRSRHKSNNCSYLMIIQLLSLLPTTRYSQNSADDSHATQKVLEQEIGQMLVNMPPTGHVYFLQLTFVFVSLDVLQRISS
ncbi:hypothetical protein HYALB_00009851 [Hymenoscyphus albidus]|uniref:Uncharacterized protein n=1 Tax=Hymenoscyphus albidus TaxID=595503 RepID=A0A9N9M333_9HELO|nr:hypothetical protein HYALB_00009851 [Hymenoscyphus albidus]